MLKVFCLSASSINNNKILPEWRFIRKKNSIIKCLMLVIPRLYSWWKTLRADLHEWGKWIKLSRIGNLLCGEKCQTLRSNYRPRQVYYKTSNLIFSASMQNIKNLVGNFGAIHVGVMHAKFQPSSFNGVGGGGDRQKDGQMSSILEQIPI